MDPAELISRQQYDLTLPITPAGPNVNCYYADEVTELTIEAGTFIGSVARGGSVNYRKLTLTPHGNTTHTECYGHISDDPQANLYNCYTNFIHEALVVSVPVERLLNGDQVISLSSLKIALDAALHKGDLSAALPKALIIRTTPNGDQKCNAHYSGHNPVYPEPGVGAWLAKAGVMHWLVDLPSVDRELDAGVLANHKGFWQVKPNGPYKNIAADDRKTATITELVFVPNAVKDGYYTMILTPLALLSDAAPSRIVLLA